MQMRRDEEKGDTSGKEGRSVIEEAIEGGDRRR